MHVVIGEKMKKTFIPIAPLIDMLLRINRPINAMHILEIVAQVEHFERIEARIRRSYQV